MAKKKKSEKHIHRPPGSNQPMRSPLSAEQKTDLLYIGLLVLFTLIIYSPVFRAGFVWDDVYYVQNNYLIRNIDLQSIFSTYWMGNYHPLTILFFAIEFQLFDLNAVGYHVVNLLFHAANIALTYYIILHISRQRLVALLTALFFAINPLHTESVTWISELKDLLYTGFFLGAYLLYLKYLETKNQKFYFLTILLFTLSLLSKAMAASFPVLLVLTDFFMNRKINLKSIGEKAPFFILAIVFGVVAIFAQQSSEAIQDTSSYSFLQRIIFAAYGFITYLWKSIIPVNQSAFYPYPVKNGEQLNVLYYLYPLLVALLCALVYYSIRFSKKIFFGFGFYAITVFLVLQFLPVGDAVMADRYSYLPSIGFFYLLAELIVWLINNKYNTFAYAVIGIIFIIFSYGTYQRNQVWENGISLWNDVIKKFPQNAVGYNNRGGTYLGDGKPEEALADLSKAIEINPDYAEALNNRSIILSDRKKNDEALEDLNRAIIAKPNYADAYSNRGVLLMDLSRDSAALADFNKAIELKPYFAQAYYNRGLLYMNQNKKEEAITEYNKALALKPDYKEATINRDILLNGNNTPDNTGILSDSITLNPKDPYLYLRRGLSYLDLGQLENARNDFNKAIELDNTIAEAYINRARIAINDKKFDEALQDVNAALKINSNLADAFVLRGNIYREQGNFSMAATEYEKAIKIDPSLPGIYYNRGVLYIMEKKFETVIGEFSKVLELKGDSAMSYYNRGMAEMFLNNMDQACQDFNAAIGLGLQAAIDARNQYCK